MSDSDPLTEMEAQLADESRCALADARADGRLDRLIASTTDAVLATNVAPTAPVSRTWWKLGGAGLAGVFVLSGAGYVATRDDAPALAVSAPAPSDVSERTAEAVAPPAQSREHEGESVVSVDALPSAPVTSAAVPSVKLATRERATTDFAASTVQSHELPVDETAASIFRRANAARHEGRDVASSELYRRLLAAHPESREAATARVIYGRMRLDGGDAREALAQFDAYLTRSPNGTLAEQALVGRASALRALGRRDEERAAWAALLRAFPESASKAEALERGR